MDTSGSLEFLLSEGKKQLSSQDFEQAKSSFLKVIELAPKESEAFFLLSWIAHHEGQLDNACTYLKKANAIQPFNKQYLLALGNVYSQLGQLQKVIELYQGYLSMDTSQAEVYYQYACVLTNANQAELAFEAFQTALNLDPKQLPYYMGFGHLLYLLNRNRDAQKVYLSALNQGLKSEGLYLNIAKLHADYGELSESKTTLVEASQAYPDNLVFLYRLSMQDSEVLDAELLDKLKSLNDAEISPENQFYRHWLLAKFAYSAGQFDKEMAELQTAHNKFNEITKFPYEKNFYLDYLNKLQLPEPPVMIENLAQDLHTLEPIFIVGVPRCGSTLIENIICSGSQQVLKGEESGVLLHSVATSLQSSKTEQTPEAFWNDLQNQVRVLYQRNNLLESATRFTDKSLENIFLVDIILALFPKAKIIYCNRHPLASIVSILKNNMVVLSWAHDMEDIVKYVDNCIEAMSKWQKKYPDNSYTISYEDLVQAPENESKKLMTFCGLEWHESCLDFYKNKDLMSKTASHIQVRGKINQDALNAYQAYLPFFQKYVDTYSWMK